MNAFLKTVLFSAKDTVSLAKSIADSGVKSVSEIWKGVSIFGSLQVLSSEDADRDETHYVLIPVLSDSTEYAVYTKRVLPPGVGPQNELPKVRIFHVPEAAAQSLLERELISKLVSEKSNERDGESGIADLLEKLADELDRETEKVSGGLLLIGGVVAAFNPLVGVGIAAKALLPSIGAKVSKAGAGYVGDKLRDWQRSKSDSAKEKQAQNEVRKLKPELFENPLIRRLDVLTVDRNAVTDPFLDASCSADAFASFRYYAVTLEAFREVYQPWFEKGRPASMSSAHYDWLVHLDEQAKLLDEGV